MPHSMWVTLDICESPSYPVTNSLWVTQHICERQSYHYDQQQVSDIAPLWKLISSSFSMINRLWVTLHIVWRQSCHIFSNDQQEVCNIAHFVNGRIITPFPTTNRGWVTLHILWMAASSDFFPMTNSKWVIYSFVKDSLLRSSPTTGRMWVALCTLWKKTVSSYNLPWSTVCEYHSTICEKEWHSSNFISPKASEFRHYWVFCASFCPFLWPTESEWCCTLSENQSQHVFLV